MRLLILVSALLVLSGCATLEKDLENVVSCVAGRPEAHSLSKWKLFSIGAKLADDQGVFLCQPKK